jgi:hypothetical protein
MLAMKLEKTKVPVYDSIDEPFVNPPPCIHTITGFFAADAVLCVQMFSTWQCSFSIQ